MRSLLSCWGVSAVPAGCLSLLCLCAHLCDMVGQHSVTRARDSRQNQTAQDHDCAAPQRLFMPDKTRMCLFEGSAGENTTYTLSKKCTWWNAWYKVWGDFVRITNNYFLQIIFFFNNFLLYNAHYNLSKNEVISSNVFFCLTKSLNPKNVQEEKQQILTS